MKRSLMNEEWQSDKQLCWIKSVFQPPSHVVSSLIKIQLYNNIKSRSFIYQPLNQIAMHDIYKKLKIGRKRVIPD